MKAFAVVALLALIAGCASTPDAHPAGASPTHYWQSSGQVSNNRYRVDNQACQVQIEVDSGAAVFEPGTESFDSYRECMVSRGYVLRQY